MITQTMQALMEVALNILEEHAATARSVRRANRVHAMACAMVSKWDPAEQKCSLADYISHDAPRVVDAIDAELARKEPTT